MLHAASPLGHWSGTAKPRDLRKVAENGEVMGGGFYSAWVEAFIQRETLDGVASAVACVATMAPQSCSAARRIPQERN